MNTNNALRDVKNIILVSSGKGGVGKSTVAANIAAALSSLEYHVGVLDADIHGPSQNMMFGIETKSVLQDTHIVAPNVSHGVKVASIASQIDVNQAVSWRGTMVTVALKNMLYYTDWGELDFLVVDMPPGTGDVQISICEILKEAKAVVVTTPQDVALLDCKKGIDLFRSKNIEVLGIVENMSGHVCSECGNIDYIFGKDGGERLAEEYETKVLGRIPLETKIREMADEGNPIAVSDSSLTGSIYKDIANLIIENTGDKEDA